MIKQIQITLPEMGRGIHLITSHVVTQLPDLPEQGLLNLFLQHTSAGLSLNENADASVRDDLDIALDKLAPENQSFYTHTMEGSDDMPAHIKNTLTGVSITIPISNGRLNMGMWQGIYLCEFRNYGGPRRIVATVYA